MDDISKYFGVSKECPIKTSSYSNIISNFLSEMEKKFIHNIF